MATDPKKKKPTAKPAAKKAAPKAAAGGGNAMDHMKAYLEGAEHGAKILYSKLTTQMGGELAGYEKNAQQFPGGVKDALGQDVDAAFGPNGAIPIQKIQQGAGIANKAMN